MSKNLKFQVPSNRSTALPKSMVKGKLEGEDFTEVDKFKISNSLSSMDAKSMDMLKNILFLTQYKDLTENRYTVNESVDEIYWQIVDFFRDHGAVETTDRMPCGDDTLHVSFEFEQPLAITDIDMDMFEKTAFVYGNSFRLFSADGKLVVQFILHGYYDKNKITEG